jgi:hypothetical protein
VGEGAFDMQEQNNSVGWVGGMLALGVAYFGWVFLAADYFQNGPTETLDDTNFWINSLVQLLNFPRVLSYSLQNRPWLIALIVVAEVGVLVLWRVVRKLERELWSE